MRKILVALSLAFLAQSAEAQQYGPGPATSGFPITIGSTSVAANSTTTGFAGLNTLTSANAGGYQLLSGAGNCTTNPTLEPNRGATTGFSGDGTKLCGVVAGVDAVDWAAGGETIHVNGSASNSPLLFDGTILTGGSATTNFPAELFQPTGTAAVTSWSTSGTGLGMNLASGFAGNFFDYHIAGGASLAKLTNTGSLVLTTAITDTTAPLQITSSGDGAFFNAMNAFAANMTAGHQYLWNIGLGAATNNSGSFGFYYSGSGSTANAINFNLYNNNNLASLAATKVLSLQSTGSFGFTGSSSSAIGPADTFISRGASAASIQLGAADVDTAPVAQTLRSQGTLAGGTSNVAGANWTFIASPGKGTGAGGSFIFQTTPAGSSGTVVGTPTTALTIDSTQKATFAATLATVGSVNLANFSSTINSGTGHTSITNVSAYGWSSTGNSSATIDTTLCRQAAGVVEIGASTGCAASGSLIAATATLNNVATDAATTDSTACIRASDGLILKGSGTLGICLGTSTRDLKTNFTDIKADWAKADKLPLNIQWNYKSDLLHVHYGPMVEDIVKVFPELVGHDKNGKAINYDWPSLLFALQVRDNYRISQLEAANDNLSSRLAKLEHHR